MNQYADALLKPVTFLFTVPRVYKSGFHHYCPTFSLYGKNNVGEKRQKSEGVGSVLLLPRQDKMEYKTHSPG